MLAVAALATLAAVAGAAESVPPPPADAEEGADPYAAQLAEIEQELAELRARAIREVVQDVLADADTRTSLQGAGMTGGHDGKFFLASPDGGFRLDFSGRLQIRYIVAARQDENPGIPRTDFGFGLARMRFDLAGKLPGGFGFKLSPEQGGVLSRSTFRSAFVTWKNDDVKLTFGQYKIAFLKERMDSSTRTLAVERSINAQIFRVGYTTGIEAALGGSGPLQFRVGLNNGVRSRTSFLGNTRVAEPFGATARLDWVVFGSTKVWKDATSLGTEEASLRIGGGVHWQGDTDTALGDPLDHLFMFTADIGYEMPGFNIDASFTGRNIQQAAGGPIGSENVFGVVAQSGLFIAPDVELFGRYGIAFPDSKVANDNPFQEITVGANWYVAKHALKLTADVGYLPDSLADTGLLGLGSSSSLGYRSGREFYVRAQFQLLF